MEVAVISKESIKPSSPTPSHLLTLPFSLLDQLVPHVFMPIVLFYPNHGIIHTKSNNSLDNINISDKLKKSLSESLTLFYPLAGRVRDVQSIIECNDEGAHFLDALVKCQLSQVMAGPNPCELNKLLPYEPEAVNDLVLAIQLNTFECGGIAIGVCISHKVADALSLVTFINSWAATARGDKVGITPRFGFSTLFPPRQLPSFKARESIAKEKPVTKRFVFTASAISSLRERYRESLEPPTRVEALSMFIWSRFYASTQGKGEPESKFSNLLHMVNLRPRMDPPLSENDFGNISSFAITTPSLDSKKECYGLANGMRDAIKRINSDFVKKLREGKEFLDFLKDRDDKLTKGAMVSVGFTSLCWFPLYESDFGWGKPIWVSSVRLTYRNQIGFMDTKLGGGIEVWVNLKEDDMLKFETDEEFLSFVSAT